MALRPLRFFTGDADFIQKYYPELYRTIEPTLSEDRLLVKLNTREQWDELENLFVDEIAGSTTENGELTENGIKLESILDCA